jgi:predicted nucleotidyltransferase
VFERLANIPKEKQSLLEKLVGKLSGITGIAAIVLGGSYASGTQHETSDLDIGLYYYEANPFSIREIQRIADEVAAQRPATVTGFYEWGPWVNGGAWIHTLHGKVDFLYRNIDQVRRTIAEAQQGIHSHDYDQQPTYGFYNVIYLAETQSCVALYDPESLIAELKQQVEIYPARLKKKVVADSLWMAEFTILHAYGFADQGDIYNSVGCITRAVSYLTQTLFALNERYFTGDKRVLDVLARLPNLPSGYIEKINHILACPGATAEALTKSVSELEQAWHSVASLPGVNYEPKFTA